MSQTDDFNIYEIIPTDRFNNDVKYYIKKKKFTRLENDIDDILCSLEKGDFQGEKIESLKFPKERDVYKVRAKNSNADAGLSNGYRLIYYVQVDNNIVYLITIYYKKDDNKIPTNNEIVEMINKYCN